jgi:hypothetical protein
MMSANNSSFSSMDINVNSSSRRESHGTNRSPNGYYYHRSGWVCHLQGDVDDVGNSPAPSPSRPLFSPPPKSLRVQSSNNHKKVEQQAVEEMTLLAEKPSLTTEQPPTSPQNTYHHEATMLLSPPMILRVKTDPQNNIHTGEKQTTADNASCTMNDLAERFGIGNEDKLLAEKQEEMNSPSLYVPEQVIATPMVTETTTDNVNKNGTSSPPHCRPSHTPKSKWLNKVFQSMKAPRRRRFAPCLYCGDPTSTVTANVQPTTTEPQGLRRGHRQGRHWSLADSSRPYEMSPNEQYDEEETNAVPN